MEKLQTLIEITYLTTTITMVVVATLLVSSTNAFSYNFLGIDIKPRGIVSESYDDNVTFAKDNKKADFITGLTFGLGAKYEGKTRSLDLTGNVTQEIFADNDNFNNTSQGLNLDFQNEFSKYDRIRLKNVFITAVEPRSFEDIFGRITGRYRYYRNRCNLDYSKDLAKQLTLSARYANELYIVSRETLQDSYLNKVGCEADYSLSSATILLLSYDFSNRKFAPGGDASTHTIATGLRRYITRKLYFDGKLGVDLIDSFNDKNFTKPLIFASITNEIDENTRASLSFTKQYYTNPYIEDVFNYWQTAGALTRQLSERLRGSISAFYGQGEYPSVDFTNNVRGASVAFIFDFRRNLKGNFTYTYSSVGSTLETQEYEKNTVLLGLTAEF